MQVSIHINLQVTIKKYIQLFFTVFFPEVHSSTKSVKAALLKSFILFGLMSKACYNRASVTGSVLAGAFLKREKTSCLFILKSKT